MAQIGPIGGTAYVKIDSGQLALRGSLEINGFMTEKDGVAGMDGVHGYTLKNVVPGISCEISDGQSVSIKALEQITNSTITAQLINGKVYVLRGGWVKGTPTLDAVDGKLKIEFQGLGISEQGLSS